MECVYILLLLLLLLLRCKIHYSQLDLPFVDEKDNILQFFSFFRVNNDENEEDKKELLLEYAIESKCRVKEFLQYHPTR